jgi:lipopolysaccharide exporter
MRLVRRFTGLNLRDQLAANIRAFASSAVMIAGVVMASSYLTQKTDPTSLSIKIVAIVLLAAFIYCGTSLVLWVLMGKPSGPEREVGHLGAKALAKLRAA